MKINTVKKLISLGLTAAVTLGAVGCGAADNSASTTTSTTASTTSTGTSSNETSESVSEDGVRTIVVSHSNASWPYNAVNENGESDGYEIAVLKAIDELLPQYEFVFEPTGDDSDLLIGVQTGKYQIGSKGAWWTEERSTTYLFPEHYIAASVTGIAFRTENADQITDLQSFADFSGLLVPLAPQNAQYTIIENYNKKNPDHQIILEASDNFTVSDQYQWVLEGRYDAAFVIQTAFEALVVKEDGEYHQYADQLSYVPYEAIPTYPLFTLGEDELVAAYDQAWETLNENGTLAALQEQYFGFNVYDLIPADYEIGYEF